MWLRLLGFWKAYKCVSDFEMAPPIRGLAFVQICAGSGHFGSQQPILVLVSCEIGSGLGAYLHMIS
jgi:hypothetical protein